MLKMKGLLISKMNVNLVHLFLAIVTMILLYYTDKATHNWQQAINVIKQTEFTEMGIENRIILLNYVIMCKIALSEAGWVKCNREATWTL